MKCILLCSPGEILEGKTEFDNLGYDAIAYPTTQDISTLQDTRDDEFSDFLGFHPEACDRPYVRSLRASFARMLLDSQFQDEDIIIFGESDATPQIPAEQLQKISEDIFVRYPDLDIFRPFSYLSTVPNSGSFDVSDIIAENDHTSTKTKGTPHVWGCHALIIPAAKRAKIAHLFSTFRLPIDTALEAAHALGEISMMVTTQNMFYQKPRTCFFDKTQRYSHRNRKIALCLSSYKRLTDLQRQIYAMMDQSYKDFHLFVAAKGLSEYAFRKILVPRCQHFIDEGKLTLRLFPNKNQLSNFLDTIRNLDTSEYELFAKIDDDDIYSRDYLRDVNDCHSAMPQHQGSFYSREDLICYSAQGYPWCREEPFYLFGSSLILTIENLDHIRKCEHDPEEIGRLTGIEPPALGNTDIGFREDHLYHLIMNESGCSNRKYYLPSSPLPHIIIQRNTPSVTRGGFLTNDFRTSNAAIGNTPETHEHIIELQHPDWHGLCCIIGNQGTLLHPFSRTATVLHADARTVTLQWETQHIETYQKNDEGLYLLTPDFLNNP